MIIPPTKASSLLDQFETAHGAFPENLRVRASAFFTDQAPPTAIAKRLGIVTSTVVSDGSFTCPASKQGNFCLDCRACWDKDVPNVAYRLHGRPRSVKPLTPKQLKKRAESARKLKELLEKRMAIYHAQLAILDAKIVERIARGEPIFKTKKEALLYIGGLSKPSKMPCKGWSISAKDCHKGSQLAKLPGSICYGCYALDQGFYAMRDTIIAMFRRKSRIDAPYFVQAFIKLLSDEAYFRWFDSGDLQSLRMLENIVAIAKACPDTKFWLPTKEYTAFNPRPMPVAVAA